MTTARITPTTAAASSADITIAAGAQVALFLVPAAAGQITDDCSATVSYKSGTDYVPIGMVGQEGIKITAEGVYRVDKQSSGISFGVTSEP